MECGHDEYRRLSLSSGHLQLLQSVSEVYFTARENDEETVDSDSESSSSDSCDDLYDMQDLDFDFLEIHTSEKMRVEKFYEETCQCKLAADEKPCSTTLKIDDFVDRRNNCSELSSTELDLVILGAIQCCELSQNQHFWQNRKKSTVYKNGILLSRPKTLHENISLSTLPPQKSLLQPGETS